MPIAQMTCRNTNVGAHRCVTQRVMYNQTCVRAGSVGSKV